MCKKTLQRSKRRAAAAALPAGAVAARPAPAVAARPAPAVATAHWAPRAWWTGGLSLTLTPLWAPLWGWVLGVRARAAAAAPACGCVAEARPRCRQHPRVVIYGDGCWQCVDIYGGGCWQCVDDARPRCYWHNDVVQYGGGCWQCKMDPKPLRALFFGLVHFRIALQRMQRRVAERIYQPGGSGFAVVASHFAEAHASLGVEKCGDRA